MKLELLINDIEFSPATAAVSTYRRDAVIQFALTTPAIPESRENVKEGKQSQKNK
jgi:hypothetical protein